MIIRMLAGTPALNGLGFGAADRPGLGAPQEADGEARGGLGSGTATAGLGARPGLGATADVGASDTPTAGLGNFTRPGLGSDGGETPGSVLPESAAARRANQWTLFAGLESRARICLATLRECFPTLMPVSGQQLVSLLTSHSAAAAAGGSTPGLGSFTPAGLGFGGGETPRPEEVKQEVRTVLLVQVCATT